jgi:DNA-binding response OmpR family regulator
MSVRILLADTDESLLKEYCDFLTELGMEVATAADGKHCMEKLRTFVPDMLVLEPHLPGGWSQRVLTALRDDGDDNHMPVFLLSTRKELDEKLQNAGYPISDYDTKPLKPYFLADRILRILAKRTGAPINPGRRGGTSVDLTRRARFCGLLYCLSTTVRKPIRGDGTVSSV